MSEYTSTADWKFEWITTWDEVWSPDFVEQWQSWVKDSASAHVFFHPALVKAWVETYTALRDIQPRFLIAQVGSDCTVFMPLILMKSNWKDIWQRSMLPVGYSEFDYHDPIMSVKGDTALWSSTVY